MKTILVVDDFASVCFYHRALLQRAGYETLAARDGLEALDQMNHHSVDLVMLDLLMPRMSGKEFLTRARAIPQYAALPVLVISTEPLDGAAAELRQLARTAFLRKPLLPDELLAAVRELLGETVLVRTTG